MHILLDKELIVRRNFVSAVEINPQNHVFLLDKVSTKSEILVFFDSHFNSFMPDRI